MKGQRFYTSDTHFFHANILKYCSQSRPFDSIEEMHEVMIERWNRVVGKNDIVYHLGDVVFNGVHRLPILDRLNGRKVLVMGNHDNYKPYSEYAKWFDSVHGIREHWFKKKYRASLTHFPPHQMETRYDFFLHGHTHDRYINDPRYINVCADANNLIPLSDDEIFAIMESR